MQKNRYLPAIDGKVKSSTGATIHMDVPPGPSLGFHMDKTLQVSQAQRIDILRRWVAVSKVNVRSPTATAAGGQELT